MKNFAYVISERLQRVTFINLTMHTETVYSKYGDDGDFAPGTIYSCNKSIVMHFYCYMEDVVKYFSKEDIIISSNLQLFQIDDMLNVPEYRQWNYSFDVFFEMLKAFSKLTELTKTISLENLIEAMQ